MQIPEHNKMTVVDMRGREEKINIVCIKTMRVVQEVFIYVFQVMVLHFNIAAFVALLLLLLMLQHEILSVCLPAYLIEIYMCAFYVLSINTIVINQEDSFKC